MDSLIFALSAVAPIVLMVIIGYIFKKLGLMDEKFAKMANKLVFRAFMPVMLFVKIYKISDIKSIDFGFIGYAMIALVVIFVLAIPTSFLLTSKKDRRGVLIQAAFRSGYSLIGIPLAESLCGEEAMIAATLLSCILIPGFNVLAVISLSIFNSENGGKVSVKKVVFDIIKNPLIIGIGSAVLCVVIRTFFESLDVSFRLENITPLFTILEYLGSLAIPLALLVLGAQFEFSAVASLKKEIISGTLIRTVIVPVLVLGVAFIFFRDSLTPAHFATFIAAFATPVAVPSVPMVQEVGGDVTLAGQLVVWSTLASAITVFLITFILSIVGVLG